MKNKINFRYLSGSLLYAFVRALLAILDVVNMPDGLVKTIVQKVVGVFANFSKGFERDLNDPLTVLAVEKDALRDRYFNGLKFHVKSYTYSFDKAKTAAAEKLMVVIRKHGWSAASFSLDEETTALLSLIRELKEKYPDEIALLDLMTNWIDPLETAEQEFEQVQLQRVEKGALDIPSVSKYRKPLVTITRKLITTLAITIENTEDETLKGMALKVDELIGRTMATAKAAATRRENDDEEEHTDDVK